MDVGNRGTPIVLISEDNDNADLHAKCCIGKKGILTASVADK